MIAAITIIDMVMGVTNVDTGTPVVGPTAAGIAAATARNITIFRVYIGALIVTALVLAYLAWLVWDAGNKVQDAVQADADAKVAGLQKDATDAKAAQQRVGFQLAQQQERAATAERSLLALQEKLRTRQLSSEQKTAIKNALKGLPPRQVNILAVMGTQDGALFGHDLAEAIGSGGWTASYLGLESSGGEIRGLALVMKDTMHPPAGTVQLQNALKAAGLPAPMWNHAQWGAPVTVITLLIAPKEM
jgi:hypothetical protein